ncbi:putative signal transducing protein [Marinoscillum sp.]|uniref:putative signal transducing protein n=1 Tax=Marinoscillum sp. TaxID=2024838 RepID=UPI003BABB42D
MSEEANIALTEVYSSTFIEACQVKNLMEHAGIIAFLKDEYIGTIFPWHSAPGGSGAVKVYVAKVDVENAQKIISKYEGQSTEE